MITEEQARTTIAGRFPGAQIAEPGPGRPLTVSVPPDDWVACAAVAKDELRCRFFSFSSAVDWKDEGIELLARVDNLDDNMSLLLRTRLGAGVTTAPSLTGIYRGAGWMERECYDMFGIRFEGHPDLRRILLDHDWEGHPLLKSYAVDTPHPPYR
jgi:NADH-quinone oxidoreductase subunit C